MSILSKITIGAAGLTALGFSAYAAAFIPTPLSTGIAPLTSVISPESVTRSIVCSGDVVGYVGDSATISGISATTRVVSAGGIATYLTMDSTTNGSAITNSGDSLDVAATESGSLNTESVAGYLATECGDPLNDQWLIGGSTTTGRDTIITISNGSDVEARIDLEIWGSAGKVDAPGSQGIVVPAQSQRSYSVAGFAPDEASPAIHLLSNGAAVWATLQTTAVRGLVPGGLDRIGPVAAPTTSVSFPVINLPTEKSVGKLFVDPAYSDVAAALRFLVPGETDATITVTLDPYAEGDPQVVTASIPAGSTLDLPITELSAGDWAVSVESDQPLVAAARVGFHDAGTGITDLAWASAAPAQTGIASIMVPRDASLGLTNFGDADATVTIVSGGAIGGDVVVPAHGNLLIPVGQGILTVTSNSPISNTVFVLTRDGIATLRGLTAPIDASSVVVIHG
jgi:hypothetical protein